MEFVVITTMLDIQESKMTRNSVKSYMIHVQFGFLFMRFCYKLMGARKLSFLNSHFIALLILDLLGPQPFTKPYGGCTTLGVFFTHEQISHRRVNVTIPLENCVVSFWKRNLLRLLFHNSIWQLSDNYSMF